MPIEKHLQPHLGRTRLVVSGHVTVSELRITIESFWDSDEITRDVLWEYGDASLKDVSLEDLGSLVDVGKRFGHRMDERQGGRTAIVAPADLEFGMMRVAEALSGGSVYSFEVRTFRTLEQATQWLEDR